MHPDRALVSGLSLQSCREEFTALQGARTSLQEYIAAREYCSLRVTDFNKALKIKDMPPAALPEEKLLFGRFLYRLGIIDWRQLIMALAWQKSGRPRIGELGVKMGYLNRHAVLMILKKSVRTGAFGITAHKMGLLSAEQVRQLLLQQKRQQKKIGRFFVENGLLNSRQLTDLLSQCQQHNRRIERIRELHDID